MPRILLLSIRTCGVITTATICRGNRRPVPILANNLLSCVRAFVRPLLSRIVKKKEKRKKMNTTAIFLYDLSYRFCTDSFFVIFHFPIYLPFRNSHRLFCEQCHLTLASFFFFLMEYLKLFQRSLCIIKRLLIG